MNRTVLIFIGILFLEIWSCGGQSDYQTRVEQLLRPWDRDNAPGFAVSVVQDNKVVFTKAYGLAEVVERVSGMNFDTYKVGSPEIICKMNERAELNDRSKSGFALGQFLNKYRGLNTI